ncbi:MAG: dipeptide ABC transporter ATP-binding protein [Pseudomonadota bacterium]
MSLLQIEDLALDIGGRPILRDIDLQLSAGGTLGLVGESGSGKSLTALAVMGLLPIGSTTRGQLNFDGADMLRASEQTMLGMRGRHVGMVFQEPMTALNPVKTVGAQVAEGLRFHTGANRADAESRVRKLMEEVELPPERYGLNRFPHELSGGQRQRVVIAMAIALRPRLLIADEPTTALDVTTQAAVLDLLRRLSAEHGMALMLISHDLAVVADMVDHIAILRDGRVVEQGSTVALFDTMADPYSKSLRAASHISVPARPRIADENVQSLLRVDGLVRRYAKPKRHPLEKRSYSVAVDHVSFELNAGESVGLVGESGCGKSTLARAVLALEAADQGSIAFDGHDLTRMSASELRPLRQDMQVVFQDPYGSFNPRHTIARVVGEPLQLMDGLSSSERTERVAHALERVGIGPDALSRYPHEFSGGQRQRIAIARAVVTEPKLIVADEPVSALDVSVRGQVLDLMADLGQRLGVAYLFISHDLHVVRAVTDRVLLMKAGRIVENGPTERVFSHPESEYTQTLLAATLNLDDVLAKKRSHTAKADIAP